MITLQPVAMAGFPNKSFKRHMVFHCTSLYLFLIFLETSVVLAVRCYDCMGVLCETNVGELKECPTGWDFCDLQINTMNPDGESISMRGCHLGEGPNEKPYCRRMRDHLGGIEHCTCKGHLCNEFLPPCDQRVSGCQR